MKKAIAKGIGLWVVAVLTVVVAGVALAGALLLMAELLEGR